MEHLVSTIWKGGLLFETDNPTGNTILIDTSPEKGGSGKGLSPKALMLSSLAGCSGLDVIMILDKMKVTLDNFKIIVAGELTDIHPKYYHKVHMTYQFRGKSLQKEKIKKAVALSTEKYCGVMAMFRKFAEINIEIHYFEK